MMKFKRLIFFFINAFFILSITIVSAADVNDTDVDEPLIINGENYLEIGGNSSYQIQDNNELLGSDPSPGTFDDL